MSEPAPAPSRLAPTRTPDTEFFWEGLEARRLLVQRCTGCGALRHPPRPMCPRCGAVEWEAQACSGRGTVFSAVSPVHPNYLGEDYVVAIVELEEGVRLVSNLIDVALADVELGMAVEVAYTTFAGDLVLPLFRPAGGS